MLNVNLGREENLSCAVRASIRSLTGGEVSAVRGEEGYVNRVLDKPITLELFQKLKPLTRHVGVTKNFREVIDYFKVPENETPAGFRIEYMLDIEGILRADLVRDISYDRNGQKRPTRVLFSADSANPYEVEPISGMLANLTCNPGIIYDLFINNPKANVGNKFKNRDEVMQELGRILGPGVDISVELNNPFEKDESRILEEAEKFREMLSPYRVVIKVPHTGPVNSGNVNQLLEGDRKFGLRWDQGSTKDMLRGHNLALMLREHGYRINFTLMFDPHQTAMALQAKPYFINAFVRHRHAQSIEMDRYLKLYDASRDVRFLKDLRTFMLDKDYLASGETARDLFEIKDMAERILRQREYAEGCDGLDSVRHGLRLLQQSNLPDTRLIICSMEGEYNYPDIDRLLVEPEFRDVVDRVVITAEPAYLAKFTSSNQVVSYQRRFMNAAQGQQ